MSNSNHFDEFAKAIQHSTNRKYPTEQELQEVASSNFSKLLDAVDFWNQAVAAKWSRASVSYCFGAFNSADSMIEIDIIATTPDGKSSVLTTYIYERDLHISHRDFVNRFSGRDNPLWSVEEVDDLLPRISAWLLEFFSK